MNSMMIVIHQKERKNGREKERFEGEEIDERAIEERASRGELHERGKKDTCRRGWMRKRKERERERSKRV